MSSRKFPELIVHVGSGKTGSSSIQETLLANHVDLPEHGIQYLGQMLEHATPEQEYDWNAVGGSQAFLAAPEERRTSEMVAVLLKSLEELGRAGIHTAIWSNEWLFARASVFTPVLTRLREAGVKIRIVVYLRRHDKWAFSAYSEWGIKQKFYEGPIRPFREWRKGRQFAYADNLRDWTEACPGAVQAFNYDMVADVVEHFCSVIGYRPRNKLTGNVRPSNELLAAWAVFNNRRTDYVSANKFQNAVRRAGVLDNRNPELPSMDELFPDAEELSGILELATGDREKVNELFRSLGEEPFGTEPFEPKPVAIDPWKMNQILLNLLFSLQEDVQRLQKQVNGLKKAIPE